MIAAAARAAAGLVNVANVKVNRWLANLTPLLAQAKDPVIQCSPAL
jgi:hypothetical protein